MQEIWENIKGYEGKYQVSNLGNIKSLNYHSTKKEKTLKPDCLKGYLRIHLSKRNKRKSFMIHRLVAETFLPDKTNFKSMPYEDRNKIKLDDLLINHKDENTKNNKVDNLEWCTNNYNIRYSQSKKILQYDLQGNFIKEWDAVNDIIRETKIAHVCDCCKGKRNHAGGYIWKYKD